MTIRIADQLYDPGTAQPLEDLLTCKVYDGFYGQIVTAAVFDGVSGLYLPKEGPMLFRALSGGQMVSTIAGETIMAAHPKSGLTSTFSLMNIAIREQALKRGLSMKASDKLPGAAFAAVRITDEFVTIVQGADCFAVWLSKGGTAGATRNQVFSHEQEMRQVIKELMRKHNQDRTKMWEKFSPVLSRTRLDRVNKKGGYALLNGQTAVTKHWETFVLRRDQIRVLLLCSDGLVPFEGTEDAQALAEMVVPLYLREGLRGILRMTREIEEKEKATSHIDHAEATAIAIEF